MLTQLDRVRAGLPKHVENNEDSDDSSTESIASEDAIDFDNACSRRPQHRGTVTLHDLFADLEAVKIANERIKKKKADKEIKILKPSEILKEDTLEESRKGPMTEEELIRMESLAMKELYAELNKSSSTSDEDDVKEEHLMPQGR